MLTWIHLAVAHTGTVRHAAHWQHTDTHADAMSFGQNLSQTLLAPAQKLAPDAGAQSHPYVADCVHLKTPAPAHMTPQLTTDAD